MVKRLLILFASTTYLDRLERDNVNLNIFFETHFHADFVSGHLDLSKATGAPIIGQNANPEFEAVIATDDQGFLLEHQNKALHTLGIPWKAPLIY
jgi:glyoxylase-like metal-dependent hydrolase (beta-lactamase superfamily II)